MLAGLCASAQGSPRHERLETLYGPIHVWTPAHYEPETAGVVVYVHGYFADVDRAWRTHRLADQFEESGINALFIACEAPANSRERVFWTSVDALRRTVADGIGKALPQGRVVAVGHSAAHRTLVHWLEDRLDTIVLLDAVYRDMPELRDWLARSGERRLINAAVLTRKWTEPLHAALADTRTYESFPPPSAGKLDGARKARVVYVRSQHDHMTLVTGGVALPMLLRALDLPVVANASRKAPIDVP